MYKELLFQVREASKGTDGQHDTFCGPSWVSHLPAGPHSELQGFRQDQIFSYNYFMTGEDECFWCTVIGGLLIVLFIVM
jgi:hypothetical protein